MTEPDVYDLAGQSETEPNGAEPGRTEQSPSPGQDDIVSPIIAGQQYSFAEVKTAAYNGEFPDGHLPLPDRIFWWAMRDMYARFKAGKITAEQGEEEKNRAMQQYRQDVTQYNGMVGVVHRIATFWKEIEATASEYAKSPNRTAEADKFYNAVYGAMSKGK